MVDCENNKKDIVIPIAIFNKNAKTIEKVKCKININPIETGKVDKRKKTNRK